VSRALRARRPRARVRHHRLAVRVRRKDGSWGELEATGRSALENPAVGGVVVNARDVTVRRALEERLRGAEKLEAVGLLAGGIAHDFNNLLTVIRGNAELLLGADEVAANARAELEEIRAAADRAATLTRHLLAFARRQVLRPRVVDVNAVVAALEPLLRRMVGAHVTLATTLDPGGRARSRSTRVSSTRCS
jgi:signal transduction histidine kinase